MTDNFIGRVIASVIMIVIVFALVIILSFAAVGSHLIADSYQAFLRVSAGGFWLGFICILMFYIFMEGKK
jgi:hypothetical protein